MVIFLLVFRALSFLPQKTSFAIDGTAENIPVPQVKLWYMCSNWLIHTYSLQSIVFTEKQSYTFILQGSYWLDMSFRQTDEPKHDKRAKMCAKGWLVFANVTQDTSEDEVSYVHLDDVSVFDELWNQEHVIWWIMRNWKLQQFSDRTFS